MTLAVPEIAPAAVRGQGRRGDDDGPARGRRRGDRPGAGPGPHPRPRARRDRRRARACARVSPRPSSSAQLLDRAGEDRRGAARARRRGAPLAGDDRRLVGGRAPAGRADAACRRVRPPAGRQRRRARRRRRPRRRRRRARRRRARTPPRPGGQVVVLKGARTVDRRPRTARSAVAPFENPALATGGTGDVLAGAIGSLLAQGLAPVRGRAPGRLPARRGGRRGRERFGDAGLLASDLPDGLAVARRRLAAIAERQTSGKRLGFASGSRLGTVRQPAYRRAVRTVRRRGRAPA